MTSTIKIFSFFYNCKMLFEKNKDINLDNDVHMVHFNNQSKYIINKCNKIKSYIKNNHFSFFDYKLFIFYLYILNDKVHWNKIKLEYIAKVSKLFSNKQYKKDKVFIDSVLQKINSDSSKTMEIKDLYEVNSNGNNILLDLILDNKISPIFYIMQYKNSKGCFNFPCEDLSDDLYRMNRITEKIIKKIKE